MQKYRAATAGYARPHIVINFDNKIIEMILAPQAVPRLLGRASEWPVIAPVGGVFAPGQIGAEASDRQERGRMRMTICAPPESDGAKASPWRCSVAFEFVGANSTAPKHDRQRACPKKQDALAALPGASAHPDQ